MLVTLSGITNVPVKPTLSNTSSPIVSTLLWILIFVIPTQAIKAKSTMLVILLDNTTLVILEFILKAESDGDVPATNPLTGFPLYIFGITTSPLGDVVLSPATRYELPPLDNVNVNPVMLAVLL